MDSKKAKTTRSETCHGESQGPREETYAEIAVVESRVDRHADTSDENTNQRCPTRDAPLNLEADSPTTQHGSQSKHVSDRQAAVTHPPIAAHIERCRVP